MPHQCHQVGDDKDDEEQTGKEELGKPYKQDLLQKITHNYTHMLNVLCVSKPTSLSHPLHSQPTTEKTLHVGIRADLNSLHGR